MQCHSDVKVFCAFVHLSVLYVVFRAYGLTLHYWNQQHRYFIGTILFQPNCFIINQWQKYYYLIWIMKSMNLVRFHCRKYHHNCSNSKRIILTDLRQFWRIPRIYVVIIITKVFRCLNSDLQSDQGNLSINECQFICISAESELFHTKQSECVKSTCFKVFAGLRYRLVFAKLLAFLDMIRLIVWIVQSIIISVHKLSDSFALSSCESLTFSL